MSTKEIPTTATPIEDRVIDTVAHGKISFSFCGHHKNSPKGSQCCQKIRKEDNTLLTQEELWNLIVTSHDALVTKFVLAMYEDTQECTQKLVTRN